MDTYATPVGISQVQGKFRVRMFRRGEVYHQSYHDTLEEAREVWKLIQPHEKSEMQNLIDQTKAYFINSQNRKALCA